MSDPLVQVQGLSKSYRLGARSIPVLHSIDFTLHRGEFVALRGASGAGKSTLLHLLAGLDTPHTGEIRFENQLLGQLSATGLARFANQRVGLIFQSYHLLPEFDALENVCLPARIQRVPAPEARRRAAALLERVGMSHRLEHRPAELSGGEQQRVAIARALVNNPDLLLADEPTGNLDSQTGGAIIALLCELRAERGLTLLMATHDDAIAAHAQRALHLVDGTLAP